MLKELLQNWQQLWLVLGRECCYSIANVEEEEITQSLAPRTIKEAFSLCKALLRSYHVAHAQLPYGIVPVEECSQFTVVADR